MPEIVKPTEKPKWAASGVITPAPSNSVQESGWTGPPQKPPFQWFNWFQNLVYRWVLYFESKMDVSLGSSAATTLTIASDAITPTLGQHLVDTEGLAATDNLANILTTNLDDGRLLVIQSVNAARVVTVKHLAGGSGQISLAYGVDLVLDDPKEMLVLKRRGALWEEVSRSVNLFEDKVTHSGTTTLPKVTGYDLGSAAFRWDVFAGTLNVSSLISDLIPDTNNSQVLGSASFAYANLLTQKLDTGTSGTTLNIGDTNATIINIGRAGQTVNILGAVNNITTTNTNVTDKLVTFNKNGAAASGSDSGFEIEENGAAAGYAKSSAGGTNLPATRDTFLLKAPGRPGIRSMRAPLTGAVALEGSYHQATLLGGSFDVSAGEVYTHHFMTMNPGTTINVLGFMVSSRLVSTGANLVTTGGIAVTQF